MRNTLLLIGAFLFFAGLLIVGPMGLLMFFVSLFKPALRTVAVHVLALATAGELIGGTLMFKIGSEMTYEPGNYQEKGDEGGMKKYGVTDEDLLQELIARLMQEGKTFEEAKAEAEKILAKAKEEQQVS
jgi:hypothetical protein